MLKQREKKLVPAGLGLAVGETRGDLPPARGTARGTARGKHMPTPDLGPSLVARPIRLGEKLVCLVTLRVSHSRTYHTRFHAPDVCLNTTC